MSQHPFYRFAFAAVLSAALPAASACSSDKASSSAVDVDMSGVVREGLVSDDQLRVVLANPPLDWSWAGGQFDAPADKATLSSSTPFVFAWHADPTEDTPAAGAPDDFEMVHLLEFSTPSKPQLLRVFSSLDSYTPDAAAWQTLHDAAQGEAITLSLTSATFQNDGLTPNGGPFIGQQLTFTIE